MADPTDRPIHVDADSARAGATPGITRYVLAASLLLVIIVFLGVYFLR